MIRFSYDKLRGRIKEMVKNESNLASMLGISHSSISQKLNGITYFSILEIEKIVSILEIPKDEIYDYFFTKKVENNSTLKDLMEE